jgi:hypothetical protein
LASGRSALLIFAPSVLLQSAPLIAELASCQGRASAAAFIHYLPWLDKREMVDSI